MSANLHDEFEYIYDHNLGKRVLIYKDSPDQSIGVVSRGKVSRYGEKVDDSLPDYKFPKPYIYTFGKDMETFTFPDGCQKYTGFPSKYEFEHRLCDGLNTYTYIDSFARYALLLNNQTGALVHVANLEDCSQNKTIFPDGNVQDKLSEHLKCFPEIHISNTYEKVSSELKTSLEKIYLNDDMQLADAAILQNVDDTYNKPKFGVVSPFIFPDRLLPYYQVYICEQCFITSREKLVHHVNESKSCHGYTKWLAQLYSNKYIPVLLNDQLIKKAFASGKDISDFKNLTYPEDIMSDYKFPFYDSIHNLNHFRYRDQEITEYEHALDGIKKIFTISLKKLYNYDILQEIIQLLYNKLEVNGFASGSNMEINILRDHWDDIRQKFASLNSNIKSQLLNDYEISCHFFIILLLFENPFLTTHIFLQTDVTDVSFTSPNNFIKITHPKISGASRETQMDTFIADPNLIQGFNILFKCIRFLILEFSISNVEISTRRSKLLVSLSLLKDDPFFIFIKEGNYAEKRGGFSSEYSFELVRSTYFKKKLGQPEESTVLKLQQRFNIVDGLFNLETLCVSRE